MSREDQAPPIPIGAVKGTTYREFGRSTSSEGYSGGATVQDRGALRDMLDEKYHESLIQLGLEQPYVPTPEDIAMNKLIAQFGSLENVQKLLLSGEPIQTVQEVKQEPVKVEKEEKELDLLDKLVNEELSV